MKEDGNAPVKLLVFNLFNFLISSHISTLFVFVIFCNSYLTVCGKKERRFLYSNRLLADSSVTLLKSYICPARSSA